MKRWEYKSDSMSGVYPHVLNGYGKDGWELVGVTYVRDNLRFPFVAVFKREIVK